MAVTTAACMAVAPDKLALTAVQVEAGTVQRFSDRELATLADRVAVGLSRLGVGQGDVVALQLPNWWQFSVTYLACSRIGAVLNPLMHIFRERELSFMLKRGAAKVLIVPKTFRGFDHAQMLQGLQPSRPDLKQVIVVDGTRPNSFDALLAGPAWEQAPDAQQILTSHRPGPDDVTQLISTSGTTGEPKGVLHTANTVMANIVPYAERLRLGSDDVVLMASPMAHQTGFLYGLMMPIMLRASVVLQDVWEPKKAIALIRSEGVSFTMASTPFLSDLAKTVAEQKTGVPSLKTFLCAGAPIPGALVEQARKVLRRLPGRAQDQLHRSGGEHPQDALGANADERLGERACAVVVTKPGQTLDFAAMVAFLKAQKIALQYIPERLVVREAMPSTPSGKVQKFKLRGMLQDMSGQGLL